MIERYDARIDAKAAIDMLEGIADSAEHPQPALEKIADLFFTGVEPAYWREKRFKPLSPKYLRRKLAKGYPAEPLVMTGDLKRSLTVPGADFQVREIKPDSVRVGTSDPVARLHRRGSYKSKDSGIPARPPIRVRPKDREAFRQLMAAHVMRGTVHVGDETRAGRRSFR